MASSLFNTVFVRIICVGRNNNFFLISLVGTNPVEMYTFMTNMFREALFNSKLETVQMSTNSRMNKCYIFMLYNTKYACLKVWVFSFLFLPRCSPLQPSMPTITASAFTCIHDKLC